MTRIMVQLERKRRETPWLLLGSALLFLISLIFNLLTWGPLSRVPKLGEQMEYRAGMESPLAWTYIKIGRGLAQLTGVPQLQVESVNAAFAGAIAQSMTAPEKVIDLLLAERGSLRASLLPWSHYGCPTFLLLWIVFTLIRPNRLNTYNARR